MGATLSQAGRPMRMRRDAVPLTPAELVALRRLMRTAATSCEVEPYLDSAEVAERLGLHKRTVLDLAHAGEFDVEGWKAFKPSHNRLRIPSRGVQAYVDKRAVFLADGADVGTGKEGR